MAKYGRLIMFRHAMRKTLASSHSHSQAPQNPFISSLSRPNSIDILLGKQQNICHGDHRFFSTATAMDLSRERSSRGSRFEDKKVKHSDIARERNEDGRPTKKKKKSIAIDGGRSDHARPNKFNMTDHVEYEIAKESRQLITAALTLANMEKWKQKLSSFVKDKDKLEIYSKEKKDRRDYARIQFLAIEMGLYSQIYNRAIVVSKVPLPNYRPDLDDKRPQREVVIPSETRKNIAGLLQKHLDMKSTNQSFAVDDGIQNRKVKEEIHFGEKRLSEPNDILMQQGLKIRDQQQKWQKTDEAKKILMFRNSLPAYKKKMAIVDTIFKNQVVVISGETGCGKTTQLPQFVLESEIEAGRGARCNIICTQPRRISAISVAERVASERGEKLGESVGYQVRMESKKGKDTRLLFCTTGILLRRLLGDRELDGITHVIVDEIHERGMNEDFLLIVLKQLLLRRSDLKLILMSATLNADLFSSYFDRAPTLHIPGFTHAVKSYFLEDILEKIRYDLDSANQLDDYGDERIWKMKKQELDKGKSRLAYDLEATLAASEFKTYSNRTQSSLAKWNPESIGFNLIEAVLCHICTKWKPGAVLVFMLGWDDINALKSKLETHPVLGRKDRVQLLACHGAMKTSEQRLIFEKPPVGQRKIILATNMAETSITINDVVFVVDCGKFKETSYDAINQTPCLLPSWISKASAQQRKGRAGRVQPGECYHLYPRCVYENFAEYQLPELLRTPLQSLCLQIKSLELGGIMEILSKALQPPDILSVQNAVEYLKRIGALDENENLTILGRYLSQIPVEPKLGKMLIMGAVLNCLDPVLTIAASLSSRDPFLLPTDRKELAEAAKLKLSDKTFSDHLTLVRAYDGWKQADKEGRANVFCCDNFLSPQVLKAMHSLRNQFSTIVNRFGLTKSDASVPCKAASSENFLYAALCAGLFPNLASVVGTKSSFAIKTRDDGRVILYLNSVNGKLKKIPCPWLIFFEKVKVNAVVLRDSTGISDSTLLLFGGPITRGEVPGHLKMLDGYLDFFMEPDLAETVLKLKEELNELIYMKLKSPTIDIYKEGCYIMQAVQELLMSDKNKGRFIFGYKPESQKQIPEPRKTSLTVSDENPKYILQTSLSAAGYGDPYYIISKVSEDMFQATVEFDDMEFTGKPSNSKKVATREAAREALAWFTKSPKSRLRITDGKLNPQEKSSVEKKSQSQSKKEEEKKQDQESLTGPKGLLQTSMLRAGYGHPQYSVEKQPGRLFQANIQFNGMKFVGKLSKKKNLAEKDAAREALAWLAKNTQSSSLDNDEKLISPEKCTNKNVSHSNKKKEKSREQKFPESPKCLLQTQFSHSDHGKPNYITKPLPNNQYRSKVELEGRMSGGKSFADKNLAEEDAAKQAGAWLADKKKLNLPATGDVSMLQEKGNKDGKLLKSSDRKEKKSKEKKESFSLDENPKYLLESLLAKAGYGQANYKIKQLPNNQFRAKVEFSGHKFVGEPFQNEKLAKKDAARVALEWLTEET